MKYITIILGILTIVWADDRRYVWTYEYLTMKPGKVEFEHYLTFQGGDRFHMQKAVDIKHNLELEIGMNERFDVGIYQNFSQPQGESFAMMDIKYACVTGSERRAAISWIPCCTLSTKVIRILLAMYTKAN